ncbi:class I SAM-dependent methyltransferase [Candidatus Saccharibacteria bacterium]|nr:class I SAM-dependent methyltransferase [Candidatus Saccharibacteria bacterium]
MNYLLIGLVGVLIIQFAVFFGPPYLPTFKAQRKLALDMLDLKPGQTFYDLGCGDGSLLIEASRRGLKAVGYELNPVLATVAWLRTMRHREKVRIVVGNFWKADLSDANGIFVFLAGRYMSKIDRLVTSQVENPIRLVSYGFSIPDRKADVKKGAMFLYQYGQLAPDTQSV